MVLEFHKLEYHGKLDFTTLEYPKSGTFLHIFQNNGKLQYSLQKCAIWLFSPGFWPLGHC